MSSTKKAALETADIRAMVGTLGDRLIDVRDRALVLIGFASAMRRGEVTALDVEDVAVVPEGLAVTIRRSKTDQEGKGVTLGLPYGSDPATCPVRAYRAWLERSRLSAGAVFRQVDRHGRWRDGDLVVHDVHEAGRIGGRAYGERVKLLAGRIGLDPATIGGHSTRRGFITSAARAKVVERDISGTPGIGRWPCSGATSRTPACSTTTPPWPSVSERRPRPAHQISRRASGLSRRWLP